MKTNKHNIRYFIVRGLEFRQKMKIKKVYCHNCNNHLEDEDNFMVIPFLGSTFCIECRDRIIIDCKPKGTNEEIDGMVRLFEFIDMFI